MAIYLVISSLSCGESVPAMAGRSPPVRSAARRAQGPQGSASAEETGRTRRGFYAEETGAKLESNHETTMKNHDKQ